MTLKVAVIDYGMGNLRSVHKAVESVAGSAAEVRVTDDPQYIRAADRVVFPGQGAARDCMRAISEHHLNAAIQDAARHRPFLGICMGLQVLMRHSEENFGTDLLNLIPGEVRRFRSDPPVPGYKIPHMGWNQVRQLRSHPLWQGIADFSRFYFVHSYFVEPVDTSLPCGLTDYQVPFVSALAQDNLFAVQFHPEKSADVGLRLLANFLEWNP